MLAVAVADAFDVPLTDELVIANCKVASAIPSDIWFQSSAVEVRDVVAQLVTARIVQGACRPAVDAATNPHVEVNVVDPIRRKGYRFAGTARVLTEGREYEAIVAWFATARAPGACAYAPPC